jgi:hypothetical protein
MTGLTFALDKKTEDGSSSGHTILGWPRIHVRERTLSRVEHRTVDKAKAQQDSPGENPADTVDAYCYMLHCLCTDGDGLQTYAVIDEEEFGSELMEGIYKVVVGG